MRKQLYYALAAVILGSAATPEPSYAETLLPVATVPTLHSSTASPVSAAKKRKKPKKRRGAGRRRR